MHLVQMAQSHATQSLRGDVDELEITSAATQLRAWLTPSAGGTAVAAFVHNVLLQARESRGDPERTEQLVVIAESAAEAQPELWLDLAAELTDLEFPPDRARAAYKEAAENADYDDGSVWRKWAEFESRQGDQEQSLYRAIRAVEADGSKLAYCSWVAGQLAAYISDNRDSIPPLPQEFPCLKRPRRTRGTPRQGPPQRHRLQPAWLAVPYRILWRDEPRSRAR